MTEANNFCDKTYTSPEEFGNCATGAVYYTSPNSAPRIFIASNTYREWYLDTLQIVNNQDQLQRMNRVAFGRASKCVLFPASKQLHALCYTVAMHYELLHAFVVTFDYDTGKIIRTQHVTDLKKGPTTYWEDGKYLYFAPPRNQLLLTHAVKRGQDCSMLFDFNSNKWRVLRDDPIDSVWLRTTEQYVLVKNEDTLISVVNEKVNEFNMLSRTWSSHIPSKKKLKKKYLQFELPLPNIYTNYVSLTMQGESNLVIVTDKAVLRFDFGKVQWSKKSLQNGSKQSVFCASSACPAPLALELFMQASVMSVIKIANFNVLYNDAPLKRSHEWKFLWRTDVLVHSKV